MRTLAFIILLWIPSVACAGPVRNAVQAASQGPVARAIAWAHRPVPRIHPTAQAQPPECKDGICPLDPTRAGSTTNRVFRRRRAMGLGGPRK